MKTALKFIALSISGLAFVSCCGLDNNYSTGVKKVEKIVGYKEEVVTVNPGGKGGMPYTKVVKTPIVKVVREKCVTTDQYIPKPDCGGKLSDEVLKRATVQGSTGEPHIGLIPTMRPLVVEKKSL